MSLHEGNDNDLFAGLSPEDFSSYPLGRREELLTRDGEFTGAFQDAVARLLAGADEVRYRGEQPLSHPFERFIILIDALEERGLADRALWERLIVGAWAALEAVAASLIARLRARGVPEPADMAQQVGLSPSRQFDRAGGFGFRKRRAGLPPAPDLSKLVVPESRTIVVRTLTKRAPAGSGAPPRVGPVDPGWLCEQEEILPVLAINELPDDERVIAASAHLAGKAKEEIMEIMGTGRTICYDRLQRARDILQGPPRAPVAPPRRFRDW